MTSHDERRRLFLGRLLAGAGVLLVGGGLKGLAVAGKGATHALPPAPSETPSHVPAAALHGRSLVYEIWNTSLRDESGKPVDVAIEGSVLLAGQALGGEQLPFDGFENLFPDSAPATVVVDARHGGPFGRLIALRLASVFVEMGSDPAKVHVIDDSDEEMKSAGYGISREGTGPFVHGTRPRPGYMEPMAIAGSSLRISRATAEAKVLGVVASLSDTAVIGQPASGAPRLGPFVIDAALRLFDDGSREKMLKDPELGAKALAAEQVGGRIGMILGDLFEIDLAAKGESPGKGAPDNVSSRWRADEFLAGTNLFAVESVAHRIVSNARQARGLSALDPHSILAAARKLGLSGAGWETIDWRKAAA